MFTQRPCSLRQMMPVSMFTQRPCSLRQKMPVKCTSHMDAEVWAGHVKYFHMVHDADFTGSKRPHEPGMQVMRAHTRHTIPSHAKHLLRSMAPWLVLEPKFQNAADVTRTLPMLPMYGRRPQQRRGQCCLHCSCCGCCGCCRENGNLRNLRNCDRGDLLRPKSSA